MREAEDLLRIQGDTRVRFPETEVAEVSPTARGLGPVRGRPTCIYVGNLPRDIRERDVEDILFKFGRLRDIDIKRARGGMSDSCYAFVEFETIRAAEDAVACRHGYLYRGRSLRVEFTAQPARRLGSNPNFIPMGGASGPPRRTGFRALVSFLPPGCRWQHLKDHMRRAGPVGFAEVLSHGRGVVEFEHAEDLKYAVRSLDKSEMRVEGRGSVIKVEKDYSSRDYDQDYSSPRYSSRSRSPRSFDRRGSSEASSRYSRYSRDERDERDERREKEDRGRSRSRERGDDESRSLAGE
ncbi:RNA recognition motif-containing protein [Toxoplasma gondii CAST]|uniref:RNA recognition motif-containing protein n=1 Tax=Toxoplasma gondii CAST TaxID=943122 RepID=A0A3R8A8K0_TOXGO|nr:RNA recognition motif-containing protein [Toxoplasma gondii CAST]